VCWDVLGCVLELFVVGIVVRGLLVVGIVVLVVFVLFQCLMLSLSLCVFLVLVSRNLPRFLRPHDSDF
jgi:hypothetical protein